MYRKKIDDLIKWKNSNTRKPLILRGARQVGKTWLMKEFGKNYYEKCAYINFDDNSRMEELFSGDFDIDRIIQGLKIECSGEVPYTRGLGSSSTCIVAGIVGAFAFKDKAEDRQEILELATAIEGHPDNVAPAIFGGLTVSVMEEENVLTLNIPVKHDYRFVALIPPFTLSTEQSRSVLPQVLPRADAIKNVSHLALMVASLINGFDDGLKLGFKDRLHQPYRGDLIAGYCEIMDVLEEDEQILGAYLSGAGPTIMALIRAEDKMGVVRIKEELGDLINDWQVVKLELDQRGYTADYE